MRAGLIGDFIRNSLSVPFGPCHFVHAILSNTILSVYHFVHTILSVPFCPLPFCPRTHMGHGPCMADYLMRHWSFCPAWYFQMRSPEYKALQIQYSVLCLVLYVSKKYLKVTPDDAARTE